MHRLHKIVLGVSLWAAVSGCPSPAAPPAPPAEIPAALKFPESVSIDVTTTAEAALSSLVALVGNGPFREEITFGPGIIVESDRVIDAILGPLNDLDIPVGADVGNFTGIVKVEDRLSQIKIDFSDYDLDGNGLKDGCSGNTAELPICYRVWVEGQRRVAGKFVDVIPTDGVIGAGEFVGVPIGFVGPVDRAPRMIYDHQNLLDRKNDLLAIQPDESGAGPIPHITIRQEGEDATAIKTVAIDGLFFRIKSQWKEGTDFWLGTATDSGLVDAFESFDNACVLISTADFSEDPGVCEETGLDVTDVEFPGPADPDDVIFPSDFPALPTF